MKFIIITTLSFLTLIGFNACKCKKNSKTKTEQTNNTSNSQTKDPSVKGDMGVNPATQPRNFLAEGYTKGWIRDKTGLDGCGFSIQLEDSSFFQPSVLEDSFKENNKKIWFKYSIKKGGVSACMSGKLIDVIAMVDRWYE